MNDVSRTSGKALASFVLGLLFMFLFVAGVPAVVLGWLGLKEVNQSDGRVRGRSLAIAGMILGTLEILVCPGWLAYTVLLSIRQKGQRIACANQMRVIGVGLTTYHKKNGSFPAGTVPNKNLPPEHRLSWYVPLLPFLGHENLYQSIDLEQAWDAEANRKAADTAVHLLMCPSYQTPAPPGNPRLTEYAGIAGIGTDAAMLPVTDPRAGVFGYDRRTRIEDVTRGVSNTMMVAETAAENGPWAAGGPATVRSVDPALQPYIGPGRPYGGLHPGGLNLLYVDGAVGFRTTATDPAVFEKLAMIHAD